MPAIEEGNFLKEYIVWDCMGIYLCVKTQEVRNIQYIDPLTVGWKNDRAYIFYKIARCRKRFSVENQIYFCTRLYGVHSVVFGHR